MKPIVCLPYQSLLLQMLFVVVVSMVFGCKKKPALQTITVNQFETFVNATGYVTDAEKFGWSIVQKDVYSYDGYVKGANWRIPDGIHPVVSPDLPVTQVSYNDAMAYCDWAHTTLPTYDQYWELIRADHRFVVTGNAAEIKAVSTTNVLGNVWDITLIEKEDQVRLAGGSLFCSPTTCNGTSRAKRLYVDKQTGNIHIGFSVIVYE
ncbi:MAG: formylglycine-generating enzyme family protein [Bacteroidia bacterium]|jgi:hypothetical protein|nr:formylglycine-generating enzyme family protein [Bacteroidia bacterium]